MMIGAPFEPRPGELIYSALARVSDAMAYPRTRSLLLAAFGTSTGIAIIDLPGRVQNLAENLFGLSPPEALEAAHQLLKYHTTLPRSEERSVGKELVRTCRTRWSQHH